MTLEKIDGANAIAGSDNTPELTLFIQENQEGREPTKSQRPVLYMIEQECGQRQVEVAQKMNEVELALGRLSV